MSMIIFGNTSLGHNTKHPVHASSVEVKKACSYTSTPPTSSWRGA